MCLLCTQSWTRYEKSTIMFYVYCHYCIRDTCKCQLRKLALSRTLTNGVVAAHCLNNSELQLLSFDSHGPLKRYLTVCSLKFLTRSATVLKKPRNSV